MYACTTGGGPAKPKPGASLAKKRKKTREKRGGSGSSESDATHTLTSPAKHGTSPVKKGVRRMTKDASSSAIPGEGKLVVYSSTCDYWTWITH